MEAEGKYYRDTWAEINLDNIAHNIKEAIKLLPEKTSLFAVVKANAYGHGDAAVAKTAVQAGAAGLAVAFLDEAISLKKKNVEEPVLVLGASRPEDAGIAAENNISLTVFRPEWLKEAQKQMLPGQVLKVHIKCDTGMGRLGIRTKQELQEMVSIIKETPNMLLEGVFTHFATADELDKEYFQGQYRRFQALIDSLEILPRFIHCANSASLLRFEKSYFTMVRLGISMYGLSPSPEIKPVLPFELKEAFSLHTKMVQVKKVKKGEKLSYGATYVAEEDEWIATLPVGYADGWIRKLQGQEVLAGGKRVPIVGRICMDQCMIRLPEEMPVGTKVTLIGEQGSERVAMDEIAAKLETINYEIPCIITARVPRLYIENEQVLSVVNPIIK